jgi:hypothetical protein
MYLSHDKQQLYIQRYIHLQNLFQEKAKKVQSPRFC